MIHKLTVLTAIKNVIHFPWIFTWNNLWVLSHAFYTPQTDYRNRSGSTLPIENEILMSQGATLFLPKMRRERFDNQQLKTQPNF